MKIDHVTVLTNAKANYDKATAAFKTIQTTRKGRYCIGEDVPRGFTYRSGIISLIDITSEEALLIVNTRRLRAKAELEALGVTVDGS